jgi:hypothetical protein
MYTDTGWTAIRGAAKYKWTNIGFIVIAAATNGFRAATELVEIVKQVSTLAELEKWVETPGQHYFVRRPRSRLSKTRKINSEATSRETSNPGRLRDEINILFHYWCKGKWWYCGAILIYKGTKNLHIRNIDDGCFFGLKSVLRTIVHCWK